ncbi:MAG: mechanosensitive ion channel family protein [Bacteroidales bacterium]|nr:mechanosensitive ion channel family protein [Bacteroidales bacterium]MDD3910761.1 mechanosensitive ion channel family protein [Bacteroidales bacterium]MDD4421393.1 mechanosensitive ion channel family protein [Bacteroidales bacterium]
MNALFNSLLTLLSVNLPDDAQKLAAQAQQVTQEATAKADSLLPNTLGIKSTVDSVSHMDTGQLLTFVTDKGLNLGTKILAAIVIYLLGAWLIKKIKKITRRIFTKKNVDPSLSSFVLSTISILLTLILVIVTIDALGIDTTSFVALLGGAGLAIGMALSGTLQNFAGGVMILIFKPFKVGDVIEAQGYVGTVSAIEIISTHMTTTDNKKIILPNGSLFNGIINNYSDTGTRRCEWTIGITYGDDVDKAKSLLIKIIKECPQIMKENAPEAPSAYVINLSASSVDILGRGWVKTEHYFTALTYVTERVYEGFPKAGLNFPYPHMNVIMDNTPDNETNKQDKNNTE